MAWMLIFHNSENGSWVLVFNWLFSCIFEEMNKRSWFFEVYNLLGRVCVVRGGEK